MKELKERKKDFEERMRLTIMYKKSKYQNRIFLNKFYKWWTTHTDLVKSNTKMRFEFTKHQPFNMWERMVSFYHRDESQWAVKAKGVHQINTGSRDDYEPKLDYEAAKQRARIENQKIVGNIGQRLKQHYDKK